MGKSALHQNSDAQPTAPAFDYKGERGYYAEPVTEQRPYAWLGEDMRQWIPGYPELFRGCRLLDIGAGEVLQGLLVAERFEPTIFVGLELVLHRMLAANARRGGLASLALCCADCYALPFSDSQFDIVLGNGVLHHLPNVENVIKAVKRVLRPGGRYIGREPNFWNPLVRRRVLGGHRSPNEHAIYGDDLVRAFRAAGFDARAKFFWRRLPWLHNRFLSVSTSIYAALPS